MDDLAQRRKANKETIRSSMSLVPLSDKFFKLTPTSLKIDEGTPIGAWIEAGKFLKTAEGAIQFWIGDWLNFGEKRYGEKYSQALEATEYEEKTLRNFSYVSNHVPVSLRKDNLHFGHHNIVAALEHDKQDKWLTKASEKGMTVAELRSAVRHADKKTLTLPDGKFSVIYADPPWEYAQEQHGKERQETVLETHYPTMPTEDICGLEIKKLAAENAVLFLWTTSPKLFEAKQVLEAWGFTYKSSMIWDKVKHNVGYYVSVRHEFLLICTKGSFLPESGKLIDSVQTIERTEHSKKPDRFYEIIEEMYPSAKKLELFARQPRKNWKAWGNEV